MSALSSPRFIGRLLALVRVGASVSALSLGFVFYETASADPSDRLDLSAGVGTLADSQGTGSIIGEVTANGSGTTTPRDAAAAPAVDNAPSLPSQATTDEATDSLVALSSVTESVTEVAVQASAPIQNAAPVALLGTPVSEPAARVANDAIAPLIEPAAPVLQPILETPLIGPLVEPVNPVLTPVQAVTDRITEPVTNTRSPRVSIEPGIEGNLAPVPCSACDSSLSVISGDSTTLREGNLHGPTSSALDLARWPSISQPGVGPTSTDSREHALLEADATSSPAPVSEPILLSTQGPSTFNTGSGPGKQLAALAIIGLLGVWLWQACRRLTDTGQQDRFCCAFFQPPR